MLGLSSGKLMWGALFFIETIIALLYSLWHPGLCVPFFLSPMKIYSQGREIPSLLYTLKNKMNIYQTIYDKGLNEDQDFCKMQLKQITRK